MTSLVRSILVVALLAGAAACQAPQLLVAGKVFVSTSITENGQPKALVPGTEVRLDFSVLDLLSASAGCNTLSGYFQVTDGRLDMPGIAQTEMGCDAARMAQDQWLSSVLSSKPKLVQAGDQLKLDAGTVQITLRELVEPDMPLVGTTWTVSSVFSPGGDPNLPEGTVATLVFNPDGTLQVDDGCNTGTGRWAQMGAGIVVTDLALTKKACVGDLGAVEDAILATLRAPLIVVVIDKDRMELRRAERTGISLRGR